MTTEGQDICADSGPAKDFSAEALRASALQLAEALLKSSAEPSNGPAATSTDILAFAAKPETSAPDLPPDVREHAVFILSEAALVMAAHKNVRLSREAASSMAMKVTDALAGDIILGVLNFDAGCIVTVAHTLNCMIDALAATRAIYLMWDLEGFDQLDMAQLAAWAEIWMREHIANDIGDARYRWPKPEDMALDFYTARSGGPVSMRFPDGSLVSASYFLDRTRSKAAPAQRMSGPVPLLMRCLSLPTSACPPIPNGRCVRKLPDGAVVTMWFKGEKLHRDPKEGPAWHRVGPSDERSEYLVAGIFHRAIEDGPAVIETSPESKREEFWVDGGFIREDVRAIGESTDA